MTDPQKYAPLRAACMLCSLIATAMLATAGVQYSPNGDEASKTAHEMASWPLHVVLGVVAIGSVWLSMHFGWKNNKLAFERDKLNADAVAKVTESMIAMRDIETRREMTINRLADAVRSRPCLRELERHNEKEKNHEPA